MGKKLINNPIIAWTILLVSLLTTITTFILINSYIQEKQQNEFDTKSKLINQAIRDRFAIYEQALNAGVAYIYSSENVTQQEWKKFVETLNTHKTWPGIQGIGLSLVVPPNQLMEHNQQMRQQGYKDYTVHPTHPRSYYTAITYLEPLDWRNQRAIGYDMWTESNRQKAMNQAVETGQASRSAQITLVQETNKNTQKGFLTYLPLYESKNTPKTVKERKEQIQGWVYAPFRINDFMEGILGSSDPQIEFEIYDTTQINDDTLLYQSNPNNLITKSDLTRQVKLTIQSHDWTIVFYAPTNQKTALYTWLPIIIVVLGTIFHLLIFYVIFSMYFSNRKTEEIVKERTRELQNIKSNLEHKVMERTKEITQMRDNLEKEVQIQTQELKVKLDEFQRLNQAAMGRETRMIELKKTINDLSTQLGKPKPYDLSAFEDEL